MESDSQSFKNLSGNNPFPSPSSQMPPPGSLVHLTGICGTGMAALAGLLLQKGYRVRGSDSNAYPPMSDLLNSLGIEIISGYRAENLYCNNEGPDIVIIGNVVRADNPEAQNVFLKGIPFISFPSAVACMFLEKRKSLVVAGTHGKTTTSSMLLSALEGCGFDPGFMIGGVVRSRKAGFSAGRPPWFILEGDEYDTAFFDKGAKFLHYRPYGLILTSMEFDHADIFKDFNHIKDTFAKLVRLVPENGVIAACCAWEAVVEVCQQNARCRVIWYGEGKRSQKENIVEPDWRIENLSISSHTTTFEALNRKNKKLAIKINQPGTHNALNALGVIALSTGLGIDVDGIRKGLASHQGVMRRQEVRDIVNGITVIDDFAHHPSAVKETLKALKAAYPENRLIAVFEPRTNTSRRSIFQNDYASAFESSDMAIIRQVPDPDKAPEGDRFSSELLAETVEKRGTPAKVLPDGQAIASYLATTVCKGGDVVAILSNGAFEGIHEKLIDELKKRSEKQRKN